MATINIELPNKVHLGKTQLSYDDFINFLSKKSVLDDIQESNIESEGVEFFGIEEEKNLMSFKSVQSLFNTL